MPPALGLGRALSRRRGLATQLNSPSICLFCSLSTSSRPRSTPTSILLRTSQLLPRTSQRPNSTTSPSESITTTTTPRTALHRALLDLQSLAPNHVNLARLQLALRNLAEPPGHESIRVAFLSANRSSRSTTTTTTTAQRLARLALADPLRPAAAWEAQLEEHDVGRHPLVVRVVGQGQTADTELEGRGEQGQGRLTEGLGGDGGAVLSKEHVIPELRVASPVLGGGNLEMLVARADGMFSAAGGDASLALDEAVLVPTVDVAATTAGHVAPVGTPVHMAVLVADGVLGAASVLSLPVLEGEDVVARVVNFTQVAEEDLADCPLVPVNVDAGSEGLGLFRADVRNALKYEALWTEANVSRISEWLRKSVLPSDEGITKAPVRNLITSLLRKARATIQEGEAGALSAGTKANVPPGTVAHLDQALSEWAQNAHAELQQQLDVAFTTRPWSHLGWWKLFWRADDVGLVTSELVALRFLPKAEKALIYLAGRIQEAGVVDNQHGQPVYTGPALSPPPVAAPTPNAHFLGRWPTQIPFTRNYLQEKTVPALQALAQKLVVQSASLAGLSSALAGLTYLSGFGAYECGAIAALGIALSFSRFQRRWDAARAYWEGEVREEGRKAIRATEASVAEVLDKASQGAGPRADRAAALEELRKVEEVITRAEEALARMK